MYLRETTKPTTVDDSKLVFTPLGWLGMILTTCKNGGQRSTTTRKSQFQRD